MGNFALLVVFAGILALAHSNASRVDSAHAAAVVLSDYEEKVLARETAESANSVVVGKVKKDFDGFRGSFADLVYRSGKYDMSATEEANDSVSVTAKGIVGSNDYFIAALVVRISNRILDSVTFAGPIDSLEVKDSAMISGIDTNTDGSDGDGPDVHGILVTDASTYADIWSDAAPAQVIGVDGMGDAAHDVPLLEPAALGADILSYAGPSRLTYDSLRISGFSSLGSATSPVVAVVHGKVEMDGNSIGYGVLYVDGRMEMSGDARWEGLVFMIGDGNKFEMRDNSRLYGALVVESTAAAMTKFEIEHQATITYSVQALSRLGGLIPVVDPEENGEFVVTRLGEAPSRIAGAAPLYSR